ncbi:MAG TPA: biopolymer transporter ExbD, partial [Mariprofundaceae bacterium]|nr:biopolymer transporter ExbD [Mariprofundaceae bacterium]
MEFEATRRSGQAPNLTPLIDIVFLLLVFFMLTAHFVRDEGLPIELPEAASAISLENNKPVEISISSDGRITHAG